MPCSIDTVSCPSLQKLPAGCFCRGQHHFRHHVLPILEAAAGMTVVVYTTRCPGHAGELVHDADLSAVDLLVFVGGDGSVYEGLQVRDTQHEQADHLVAVRCAGTDRFRTAGLGLGLLIECGVEMCWHEIEIVGGSSNTGTRA